MDSLICKENIMNIPSSYRHEKSLMSISRMLIDLRILSWYRYRTKLLHCSLRDKFPGKLLVVSHTYYVTNLNHFRRFFPNVCIGAC